MSGLREDANKVHELVDAIRPLLAGNKAEVAGAALADLLAMWLASHVNTDDEDETRRIREVLLNAHIAAARALIEPNYRMLIEPELKRRRRH